MDEQLYYSLSLVPPPQPTPLSVSRADEKPLIALGKTAVFIAINDTTFWVQLVVTRSILFPVVLRIDFLRTHGAVISFPINQLYLTNPSPKATESSINTNHMHNTHTPPMHTPNTYLPHSRISVHPNPPYPIISTEPVTMSARTSIIMTIPCVPPGPRNYLFEPSEQHFVDQPVQYTPVIINAENDNLPVHFINHSDHEVVIPKHSYVKAMEEVQESDQGISHTNTSPEPVSQNALFKCLVQSDLLSNQRQRLYHVLQENSGVFGSSIADLTSTPLVKHYTDTGNAKPIKQREYHASHYQCKNIEKKVQEMLQIGIIKLSVNPWDSFVVLVRKADQTLQLCIDYRNLNKATIKDSYLLPHIQATLDTLYRNTLLTTLDFLKVYRQIKVEENSH